MTEAVTTKPPQSYTPEGVLINESRHGIKRLLKLIGEDPDRDGLKDTPDRVIKAMREMTAGYAQDPAKILSRVFETDNDEMIIVREIDFTAICEHHLLPFRGRAHVGYIPGLVEEGKTKRRIVGLSKIPRLVHCFAQRLQVQETLTQQIADALMEHLKSTGVGVVVEATHLCMAARGVKSDRATMVTSCLRGSFKKPETRAEFLALARDK